MRPSVVTDATFILGVSFCRAYSELEKGTSMTFKLQGYSERGMIWTLFGELARRNDANKLLAELLNKSVLYKGTPPSFVVPDEATVLIEQSFSDFGDADVLILIEDASGRRCVFVEAKVSCRQRNWSLARALPKQAPGTVRRSTFSNLYCQLYAKQCLVETLRTLQDAPMSSQGVPFLNGLGFTERRIGNHEVVQSAVELLQRYVGDATYLALVPSIDGFNDAIGKFETDAELEQGTCKRWGALAWAGVEEFCQKTTPKLTETLRAFEYNGTQIYGGRSASKSKQQAT
jgi:hypothetical protein